jgi:hypothetical protein
VILTDNGPVAAPEVRAVWWSLLHAAPGAGGWRPSSWRPAGATWRGDGLP